MHKNNPHINGYDMAVLACTNSKLKPYIELSKQGRETINFSDAVAVKELNKALLMHDYQLEYWDIPTGYLCPPIPGRADYLLGLNDVLQDHKKKDALTPVMALDIGTGANMIYPIIGYGLFGWQWVASELDSEAIKNAQMILNKNPKLKPVVKLRQQNNANHIFKGIIDSGDYFDVTCCNPPFHKSAKDAEAGTIRKNKNLNKNKQKRNPNGSSISTGKHLNFEGKANELWCKGGELEFVKKMINESQDVAKQVGLFSCLISKGENVKPLLDHIKMKKAKFYNVYDMQQGNKTSRFIVWNFN